MIGMQYKIILPSDYNMEIIRKRVADNGVKTDGFQDLICKAYLITEKNKHNNLYNSYAPFYIWNSHIGMNMFLFKGYYDNILTSFGWQQIHIGVPLYIDFTKDISKSKYLLEITGAITENNTLQTFREQQDPLETNYTILGETCIYNPDKWQYSKLYFFEEIPEKHQEIGNTFEILHVSQGK